jgi:DtxR family transcriptional regulator, Mn-dependent transcriptional regulator
MSAMTPTQTNTNTNTNTNSDSGSGTGAAVTPAMEDYLKAVYQLRDDAGEVTVQQMVERLGVSGPSVTNMVKRLHDLGLLRHTRYHGVQLTPQGERIAVQVVRHHRLLERFLVEHLGYGWDEVHAEAERLEHHISEEFEARVDALLGHPIRDPHGDPIPTLDGDIDTPGEASLLDLEPGTAATIVRVSDRDPELLRYLGGLGLYPGVVVALHERLPFEGPLRVTVDGAEHLLGPPLAAAIFVHVRAD